MNKDWKQLEAEISMGMLQGGDHDREIRIEVNDRNSAQRLMHIYITAEALGELITGQASRPCQVELNTSPDIGKIRETKTEVVEYIDRFAKDRAAQVEKVLSPYEVDGWEANRRDYDNHHRQVGRGSVKILFERWVDPPAQSKA
jgi:hypothetical protein